MLKRFLSKVWRFLFDGFRVDERRQLIEMLQDHYVNEARDVAQFEDHAGRMPYPHFRDRLLRIAEEEKTHVEWLRAKIRELGGEEPELSLPIQTGRNAWENLLLNVQEERRDIIAVPERLYSVAERIDPEIAAGLRRMHEQERRHRQEMLAMLMRADPQAAAVAPVGRQNP